MKHITVPGGPAKRNAEQMLTAPEDPYEQAQMSRFLGELDCTQPSVAPVEGHAAG